MTKLGIITGFVTIAALLNILLGAAIGNQLARDRYEYIITGLEQRAEVADSMAQDLHRKFDLLISASCGG